MTSKQKVALLREAMAKENIDAFIVFSADPHMSEYLPEEWLERTWISGFTGSAGFVVITREKAALWTDGRYFVQAVQELEGSDFELMKEGVEGTPNYIDWLKKELPDHSTIALNALATSHLHWNDLEQQLAEKNIKIINKPLLKNLWVNRVQEKETAKVFVHPVERAGLSVGNKLDMIRKKMKDQNADVHIITALDDVAWTTNLRGSDVQYNPVFLAYLILSFEETQLFIGNDKLNDEAKAQLKEASVTVHDYDSFYDELNNIKNKKILISPNTNQAIFNALQENNTFILAAAPGNLMKARKTEVELQGFRTVMRRDGVAMVKFIHWLKTHVGKEPMNEVSIGKKLKEFRQQEKNFVGESFGSIIGYKGNGAIVHYSAKEEDCKEVTNEGTILIDSGGQYLEGTTDITRTLSLGQPSEQFREDSTRVLQGMIRLSMVRFPKGTRGVQLDAVARMPLWNEGKDYAHGTGHGVGSFMNVHEGPQNIRKDMNFQELLPGMVCSNEPGFYVENEYGIRHENLIAVREWENTRYGTFYAFETLTICPFDRSVIKKELLREDEINWLNGYHAWCKEMLEEDLSGDVKNWFLDQVKPL